MNVAPTPINIIVLPPSGTAGEWSIIVMDPNAPRTPPVGVMAMVNLAAVASNPPGPSSTVPSAERPSVLKPPALAVTGLAAVKVNTGPAPPDQMIPEVTPKTIGLVNAMGVPTPIDGVKLPVADAPNANGMEACVARAEIGLFSIAIPPKATSPVIGRASEFGVANPKTAPRAAREVKARLEERQWCRIYKNFSD